MDGALTAADTEDVTVEDELAVSPTGFEVGVSQGMVADLTPAYDQAIQRLREQRKGLSARERLGALLVGFGQPTRGKRWQDAAANAGAAVMEAKLQRRKEDADRRRELERLMSAREVAQIRAGAKGAATGPTNDIVVALGRRPNSDEIKRIGYAQRLWPEMSPQDLVKMLYHPKVETFMLRPSVVTSAATQGMDPGAALESLGTAVGAPTLGEFLTEARKVNPGVSDAELTTYYNTKYGER